MKLKISFLFIFASFLTTTCFAQEAVYLRLVSKADSLYNKKEFKQSALTYSAAFKANGWMAGTTQRYNAACSWALANVPDSAFFNLQRIASKGGYSSYDHIIRDPDLNSLHKDKRWEPVLALVKKNKKKEEANLNKPLAHTLDSIFVEDQGSRGKIDSVEKKFGRDSKEMKSLFKKMAISDSLNLITVTKVLDKYGWLGEDVVGKRGNLTLFLVIQHSELKIQQRYLPIMRVAVKNNKANPANLALLEDRVALGEGKKQIYGSQIISDPKNGKPMVAPIEDEINVNKRRASVGLQPLEEYVKMWNINYKLPVH